MRAHILIVALVLVGCHSADNYTLQPEWGPHKAMMVSFNDNDSLADSVSVEIVKAISPYMKVYCVIMGDSMKSYYSNWFRQEGVHNDSIEYMDFGSSFSYSIRDPLFFLKDKNGKIVIADFAWNDYGYLPKDLSKRKSFIQQSTEDRKGYEANFTRLFQYPLINSKMVTEGGAIEVNGKGSLIQVESVNKQRNPNMNLKEQEIELKKMLGVTNIIWLKNGLADDPDGRTLIINNYFGIGVNGHVDEFCRFINPNTIFLAFPDSVEAMKNPIEKLNYERMLANFKTLTNSTDQDGKPFTIIKVPTADINPVIYILDSAASNLKLKRFSKNVLKKYNQFKEGDTTYFVPACSYLNFLVTNNLILIPKYWKAGLPESTKQKDEKVKKLFESYFPDRKIVQINPLGLNINGGGIHCWTQQVLQ